MTELLRTMVRGAYDLQKLRIQTGNRIAANFKAKLGQEPGEPEEMLDSEAANILKDLRQRFKRLTDGLIRLPTPARFKGDNVISTYTELCLIAQYVELDSTETVHFRRLGNILKEYPIWNEFLLGRKGVGPAMGGVIISEFDIHKARYPSSLWAYSGMDVADDGRGRSRRKEHLVKVKYTNKDGKEAERDSITFNPFLKTKLLGVLGPSFLRCKGDDADVYNTYKHRLETDPTRRKVTAAAFKKLSKEEQKDAWSPARIHNAAIRYMVKQFLCDLYNAWRPLEGLPVAPTYHEAKQGHKHEKRAA